MGWLILLCGSEESCRLPSEEATSLLLRLLLGITEEPGSLLGLLLLTEKARTCGSCRGTKESSCRLSRLLLLRLLTKHSTSSSCVGAERPRSWLSKDRFVCVGTKSTRTESAGLGLLRCGSEASIGLGLSLTEGSGTGTESTGARGCSAKSTSCRLLTEGRVTEETSGLLLWLRGAETTRAEAGRLLWLGLTKRTEPSPGGLLLWLWLLWLWLLRLWLLLLLLAERPESCSSGCTSGSKGTSASTKPRLRGLRGGLGLVKQAYCCRGLCRRAKSTGTKSSCGGCLTVLLIVLQP